jgi:hypothetical protein
MFEYMTRDNCIYEKYEGALDKFQSPSYSELKVIKCMRESTDVQVMEGNSQVTKKQRTYCVIDESITDKDRFDGLVASEISILRDIDGQYLYTKVLVR